MGCFLLAWPVRRWTAALIVGAAAFLVLGAVTAVIPNPVFGRSIAPADWALAVLVVTSVLSGLLFATYVGPRQPADEQPARRGALGAALAYFAIGCPVCNKLVLVALGSAGAVQFFAPVQPYLAVAGIAVLGWALWVRLRGEAACAMPMLPMPEETESRS